MATCKDCLHFEVCAHRYEKLCKGTKVEDLIHACTKFKDRTQFAEVIRCKDCIHFQTNKYTEDGGYCNHFGYYDYAPRTSKGDFCSYGERREGE